jgi:hypothetical protein
VTLEGRNEQGSAKAGGSDLAGWFGNAHIEYGMQLPPANVLKACPTLR